MVDPLTDVFIREGRTGFAYAGTLDDRAIAEVLAEARHESPAETCTLIRRLLG